ncbi:hypothetical protein SGLAD_v1c05360 [Spiroplasma gladiatoris]|uniref:Uncharacterized protein n=1 Tax=Spiroplasma gladiatoris TaxID=2143 RepID=A0A4P7AH34_9MOLU|nr:hypothetical protein [Spiroplasma gladiatoris]QBQ07735.1 hypothetical protein SGLAD_v1c05360 [Spiroplasma gladiatoris]
MQNRDLLLTIFISIWLLALLTTGLLAYFYSKRIKGFKVINDKYLKEFEEAQKIFTLKEIDIDYELPKDQKCFYNKKLVSIFFKKNKIKDNQDKIKINDYKNYFLTNKLKKDLVNIYLTNKNLVIEFSENFLKVDIKEIESIVCYTFFIDSWKTGIELIIKNKRYLIDCHDFDLVLSYQTLIKERNNE